MRRTIAAYQVQRYVGHFPLSLSLHDSRSTLSPSKPKPASTPSAGIQTYDEKSESSGSGSAGGAALQQLIQSYDAGTQCLIELAVQLFDEVWGSSTAQHSTAQSRYRLTSHLLLRSVYVFSKFGEEFGAD